MRRRPRGCAAGLTSLCRSWSQTPGCSADAAEPADLDRVPGRGHKCAVRVELLDARIERLARYRRTRRQVAAGVVSAVARALRLGDLVYEHALRPRELPPAGVTGRG